MKILLSLIGYRMSSDTEHNASDHGDDDLDMANASMNTTLRRITGVDSQQPRPVDAPSTQAQHASAPTQARAPNAGTTLGTTR
jgi:hypothetical protein